MRRLAALPSLVDAHGYATMLLRHRTPLGSLPAPVAQRIVDALVHAWCDAVEPLASRRVVLAEQDCELLPPASVHPSASVSPLATLHRGARIGRNVRVAAGALIGPLATLRDGAVVRSHVRIGALAVVAEHAVVGADPSDQKDGGFVDTQHPTDAHWDDGFGVDVGAACYVGPACVIERPATRPRVRADAVPAIAVPAIAIGAQLRRHHAATAAHSVDPAAPLHTTPSPDPTTRVGDGAHLMAHTHVGHGSDVGRGAVLTRGCAIGGHVSLGDACVIGGNAGVQQHARVGTLGFVGALSAVLRDVPAACAVQGSGHGFVFFCLCFFFFFFFFIFFG
jgi:carbonic anhydrase/acetyltransferase-like protein (isoleucine patch superfamily)